MLNFLTQLFETGDIVVPRRPLEDRVSVTNYLRECEATCRTNWPGLAPEFNVEVALTATQAVLMFCQSAVYRELDEGFVANRLEDLGISGVESASTQYSGDLVLRFLPDIYDRLKRTTAEDPILPALVNFAKRWPLSSVGIPDTVVNPLPECYTMPSMFRAYVDRIIQRGDVARCADQQVAKAVKAAIGDHRELATGLADHLSDR